MLLTPRSASFFSCWACSLWACGNQFLVAASSILPLWRNAEKQIISYDFKLLSPSPVFPQLCRLEEPEQILYKNGDETTQHFCSQLKACRRLGGSKSLWSTAKSLSAKGSDKSWIPAERTASHKVVAARSSLMCFAQSHCSTISRKRSTLSGWHLFPGKRPLIQRR